MIGKEICEEDVCVQIEDLKRLSPEKLLSIFALILTNYTASFDNIINSK